MRGQKSKTLQLVTLVVFFSSLFPCMHGAFAPSWSSRSRPAQNVPYENENNHRPLKQRQGNRPSHQQRHHEQTSTRRSLSTSNIILSLVDASSPWMPLYLSCLAGASTSLGAAIVWIHPQQKSIGPNTMSFSLALAGSVMITVSILSLGPECLRDTSTISSVQGADSYQVISLWSRMFVERVVSFGLGCLLYRLLSYFTFPEPEELVLLEQFQSTRNDDREECNGEVKELLLVESPLSSSLHHDDHNHYHSPNKQRQKLTVRSRKASQQQLLSPAKSVDSTDSSMDEEKGDAQQQQQALLVLEKPDFDKSTSSISLSQWSSGADLQSAEQQRAWRVAMLLFVSLLIHNFPEGLAVAASSVQSTKLGMAVAFGIMIHNIPEGIAIAVPCLAARPDRPWLAFLLASGSGLAEPLGAAVALLVLRNTTDVLPMENVLAFVAGIMIMVAVCELFPEAKRHATQGKEYFVAGTLAGILIMGATELYLPS